MVLEYWMWPGVGVSLYGAGILDVAWCRSKLVWCWNIGCGLV